MVQGQFVEKNNDALHTSLEALILDSKNELLRQIFDAGLGDASLIGSAVVQSASGPSQTRGKLTFISVGSKFRSQLAVLMEKLRSTVRYLLLFLFIVPFWQKFSETCIFKLRIEAGY